MYTTPRDLNILYRINERSYVTGTKHRIMYTYVLYTFYNVIVYKILSRCTGETNET